MAGVLRVSPASSDIERRNRALVAFLALTGIRVGTLIDLRLRHVNLIERTVRIDPREVAVKFDRSFTVSFFPVDPVFDEIFTDYVRWLRDDLGFRPDAPLFPRSRRVRRTRHSFGYEGLEPMQWTTTQSPQRIVREIFDAHGYEKVTPHAFRTMLALLGNRVTKTQEEAKAWSQNLGHRDLDTTMNTYATLDATRQKEVIEKIGQRDGPEG